MKMFLRLLLAMTCSGTLALLCYFLFIWCLGRKINYFWRYVYLKLCLVLYLIPFPLLKLFVVPRSPFLNSQLEMGTYVDMNNLIHIMDDGIVNYVSSSEKVLIVVWGIICIVIVLHYLYRYTHMKRLVNMCVSVAKDWDNVFMEEKMCLGIKRKTQVKYVDTAISAFTYGVIRPTVVLSGTSEESMNLVIRHELYHIKHNDFLFRALAHLILLIHCFNPFVYLFLKEIKEVQEARCDESMAKKMQDSEKRQYGYMLLQIHSLLYAKEVKGMRLYFANRDESLLKRRIKNLTNPKPRKNMTGMILLLVSMAVSSIPALAYDPPEIFDWRGTDTTTEEFADADWIYIEDGDAAFSYPEDEVNFQYADTYILLEDGSVILGDAVSGQRAVCAHSYKAATIKEHVVLSNGGCKVIRYSGKRCSICGDITDKTYVSETTYATCPH